MVLLVVSGTLNWNEPAAPVIVPAVFAYGPCTLTELWSVNEPELSYGSVVVKFNSALVPTRETFEKAGWGALTVSVADGATLPAALVTATVYVAASDNWALVIVSVLVVTPAKWLPLTRFTPLVFHW